MSEAPLPSPATPWIDPKTGQPRPELWAFLNSLLQDIPGPFSSNEDALNNGVKFNELFRATGGQVRWLNNTSNVEL
jgi:hypothetical protein